MQLESGFGDSGGGFCLGVAFHATNRSELGLGFWLKLFDLQILPFFLLLGF